MRRLVALVVAVGFVAACAGGNDEQLDAETDSELATTTEASTVATQVDGTVDTDGTEPAAPSPVLVAGLGAAGISVSDVAGIADGDEFTSFQVAAMQRQLDSGGGILGASLDGLGGAPGGLPISFLIAGWIVTQPTPAAAEAAAMMGAQEWEQAPAIVFPTAVLAMFAFDVANSASVQGAVTNEPAGIMSASFAPGLSGSPGDALVCSELSDWFGGVLDHLFESLKADTDGVFGFLAEIWNAAVDLAKATIGGVIEVLTAPVVAIIAEVIGVIGTLSMAASLLVPWSVDVTETDPRPRFAIGDEADLQQRFTAFVDTNIGIDWPAELLDCAAVAGFDLPDPNDASGAPVEWSTEGLEALGAEEFRDDELDDENEAVFDWVTGREDSADGDELVGVVAVTATITSPQIEELESLLRSLISNHVPVEPIGAIVEELFIDLAGPVFDKLTELVQVSGSSSVRVVHHAEPADPVPTSTAPPTQDLTDVDPCSLLTFEEAAMVLLAVPDQTRFSADGSVSSSGLGGSVCRWTAEILPRVDQHFTLDIHPSAQGRLDDVASWNPWGYWDAQPLPGIADEARVMVSNGSSEFGSPAGTIQGVVVTRGAVQVRLAVSNDYPASADPFITLAELVIERLGS